MGPDALPVAPRLTRDGHIDDRRGAVDEGEEGGTWKVADGRSGAAGEDGRQAALVAVVGGRVEGEDPAMEAKEPAGASAALNTSVTESTSAQLVQLDQPVLLGTECSDSALLIAANGSCPA
jgi:hypothetical protein